MQACSCRTTSPTRKLRRITDFPPVFGSCTRAWQLRTPVPAPRLYLDHGPADLARGPDPNTAPKDFAGGCSASHSPVQLQFASVFSTVLQYLIRWVNTRALTPVSLSWLELLTRGWPAVTRGVTRGCGWHRHMSCGLCGLSGWPAETRAIVNVM